MGYKEIEAGTYPQPLLSPITTEAFLKYFFYKYIWKVAPKPGAPH